MTFAIIKENQKVTNMKFLRNLAIVLFALGFFLFLAEAQIAAYIPLLTSDLTFYISAGAVGLGVILLLVSSFGKNG